MLYMHPSRTTCARLSAAKFVQCLRRSQVVHMDAADSAEGLVCGGAVFTNTRLIPINAFGAMRVECAARWRGTDCEQCKATHQHGSYPHQHASGTCSRVPAIHLWPVVYPAQAPPRSSRPHPAEAAPVHADLAMAWTALQDSPQPARAHMHPHLCTQHVLR